MFAVDFHKEIRSALVEEPWNNLEVFELAEEVDKYFDKDLLMLFDTLSINSKKHLEVVDPITSLFSIPDFKNVKWKSPRGKEVKLLAILI